VLDINHAGFLVETTVQARCLARVIEGRALVAVRLRTVLVAHINHAFMLVLAAVNTRLLSCRSMMIRCHSMGANTCKTRQTTSTTVHEGFSMHSLPCDLGVFKDKKKKLGPAIAQ
jgi:hypothetical protein